MDEADIASEHEAQVLALRLLRREPVPERTGYCLNCDALMINVEARYCDALCREDHERRTRAQPAI